ncbi:MAG: tetratricopeptide repeat protein [Bacteroidales bacterium]
MRYFFVILFFIAFIKMQGQENIDSLIQSWNKLSAEYVKENEMDSACKYGNCSVDLLDQNIEKNKNKLKGESLNAMKKKKAEALSNLVTAYGNSDRLELATECYQSALEIYREINDHEGVFQLHVRMGRVYDLRTSYSKSISYYQKARFQAMINDDKKGQALCCYFIGLNNRYLGNYYEALKNHLEDLQIQESINNKVGIASAYVTIAAILELLNDTESAFEKLAAAELLYEEMGDTMGIAMVYNDFGKIYYSQGDTSKALKYHLKAAELRSLVSELNGLGASNLYIANIYNDQRDYERALTFLDKANDAFNTASNPQGVLSTYIEFAEVFQEKNDLDSSLIFLDQAKTIATEIMNYVGLIDVCTNKGEIRLKQKNYTLAVEEFNNALAIAKLQNNHSKIYLLNTNLAIAYKMMGDYKRAFEHQKTSIFYKDSVFLNTNLSAAVQMDMEYNYKKEKLENELLQEKKEQLNQANLEKQKTQKKLFFSGVLIFLILSLGLWSRLRFIRKAGRELLARKEEAERLQFVAEYERSRAKNSEKAKEQFLANMSHEIRTPMNAIKGMTDIILKNDHPVEQDKYLYAIKQSSENLMVILNEILDLSKLEAGKMDLEKIQFEPLNVIHSVENTIRITAEDKGLELKVELKNDIPKFLCGDPTKLYQILINLAGNAVKFTDKGGVTILVETKSNDDKQAVLQFKITDTGIGIPKDKTEAIFEVFTQADTATTRKYGGTGLGLTICKHLVELYQGSISVESELNGGSTFIVEIPFDIIPAEKQKEDKAVTVEVNNLKILLAEDNEFNLMLAKDVLESAIKGVTVDVAENGRIAVDKIQSGSYDLILMDVQMPEMDGYESTKAIRKMNGDKGNIPIIAMTANVLKTEVDKCYEAGMNGYVAKPFDRDELLLNINQILNSSRSFSLSENKQDI